MTDGELKKLKRSELLEILVGLSEQNDALTAENETLKARLAERTLTLEHAGSIAEAALQISGVFAAAQDAADRYLESVKQGTPAAAQDADGQLAQTRAECEALRQKTETECAAREQQAATAADAQWQTLRAKLDRYCADHPEAQALVDRLNQQH